MRTLRRLLGPRAGQQRVWTCVWGACRLTRPYTSTEANPNQEAAYSFANTSRLPSDPVSVDITVRGREREEKDVHASPLSPLPCSPRAQGKACSGSAALACACVFCPSRRPQISNAVWTLYLEPEAGWTPSWQTGMIVLVVLGSTVLALLVAVIMASWAQQKRLLNEVMESNAALAATTRNLEEEKLRLDALLVRTLSEGGGGLACDWRRGCQLDALVVHTGGRGGGDEGRLCSSRCGGSGALTPHFATRDSEAQQFGGGGWCCLPNAPPPSLCLPTHRCVSTTC